MSHTDETFKALLDEHDQLSSRIRSHLLDAATEANEADNPAGVHQAMKLLDEYSEDLTAELIKVDELATEIDDIGAEINAWDEEDVD